MTRLQQRGNAAPPLRAVTTASKRDKKNKKPYKIVMEAVTTEKKKLTTIAYYHAKPPHGFTFVPAGDAPELTDRCKELCRKEKQDVLVVSSQPKNKVHQNPEKISHHIHRIGHHFPTDIVDRACDWLGFYHDGHHFRRNPGLAPSSRLAKILAKHKNQSVDRQVEIAMRDLFPKLPDKDLKSIVKHAFKEGTNRVGNSALDLPRRVQLAVTAHIRHVYTDYDRLLKEVGYLPARARVEQACLAQLKKWMGEDDPAKIELEESFREVIVLDDDDDDDDSETDNSSEGGRSQARSPSFEFVSQRADPHELPGKDIAELQWIEHRGAQKIPGQLYIVRPERRRRPQPLLPHEPQYRTQNSDALFPTHSRPHFEPPMGASRPLLRVPPRGDPYRLRHDHNAIYPRVVEGPRHLPTNLVSEPRYSATYGHRPTEIVLRGGENLEGPALENRRNWDRPPQRSPDKLVRVHELENRRLHRVQEYSAPLSRTLDQPPPLLRQPDRRIVLYREPLHAPTNLPQRENVMPSIETGHPENSAPSRHTNDPGSPHYRPFPTKRKSWPFPQAASKEIEVSTPKRQRVDDSEFLREPSVGQCKDVVDLTISPTGTSGVPTMQQHGFPSFKPPPPEIAHPGRPFYDRVVSDNMVPAHGSGKDVIRGPSERNGLPQVLPPPPGGQRVVQEPRPDGHRTFYPHPAPYRPRTPPREAMRRPEPIMMPRMHEPNGRPPRSEPFDTPIYYPLPSGHAFRPVTRVISDRDPAYYEALSAAPQPYRRQYHS